MGAEPSVHDVDIKADALSHVEDAAPDYARNIYAKIRNPLAGISRDDLRFHVSSFCQEYNLVEKEDVFFRGALVAQSPEDYNSIPELSDDERHWLAKETTHRWHLPKALYYTIALCSLGSAIQGWDNTGANGANLSFPKEFGIEHNSWLIGCINAAPTLFGLCSSWAADPVNNLLGRRGTVFLTGLFCIFPVLGQGFTRNWWELLICRLLMGLGMGIKISTIPVYTAEVSPASIRGGLVTSFQMWVSFGMFIGYATNLIFYKVGRLAWRFQLAAAFAPAIPVVIWVWYCPESPRWLMKKGRYLESFKSFCRLRNTELQAARDLYYAHCQVMEERDAFAGASFLSRAWELVAVPRLRRATVASAWIVISQQFSGINIMAFYSSTIFANAGYSVLSSLLASLGFGIVLFVFAFPAIYTMDTYGRRNLLLITFPNMAWCLLAAGLCFLLPTDSGARIPLIALFIYIFTAFYGPGMGPLPSIYFSEAFPLSHRELGAGMTICINNAVGSALSLTFPSLLDKITPTGAFGFYAGLNVLAFLVIFLIVPETKKRTLEELDYIFSVPTRRHISYQLGTWLPWWFKRYVLFNRKAQLEPLYALQGVTDT
ncbi:sugar porter (SP) family MFS transporter [Pochonia chlamydosporia 170]|uniref:Sugar porter (SP) family MFS transporter n=1 Tax=Pochonia chlamydosporia 170 TaxID=1380566 RepID=A0A179FJ22_METCM|nr:sugar porter (SP) family MFS transporter [Pochonia chlamydosporia 170]OAQ65250.1 sugar porter (SP) family MFS transporter [Pochonia chlamydosporia 170]